ncbi:hypothetical protein ALC57_07060 [Trachymyrmex cornetzi]|uniref:Uncharacterized protein n=1 Tax=Trachymyrmex cornetzi TaxID=471704 RepID=A0A195E654_9HYME|nr:hypothetical protein ALC57_07060 [Trachymyrmex cornetzi]
MRHVVGHKALFSGRSTSIPRAVASGSPALAPSGQPTRAANEKGLGAAPLVVRSYVLRGSKGRSVNPQPSTKSARITTPVVALADGACFLQRGHLQHLCREARLSRLRDSATPRKGRERGGSGHGKGIVAVSPDHL